MKNPYQTGSGDTLHRDHLLKEITFVYKEMAGQAGGSWGRAAASQMSIVSLPASRIISFRIAKLLSNKDAKAALTVWRKNHENKIPA